MDSIHSAAWIRSGLTENDAGEVFAKQFSPQKPLTAATLQISALGVYHARVNGQPVGDFVLAPGWTAYKYRVQYQCYDITALLAAENTVEVTLGRGWRALDRRKSNSPGFTAQDSALIAAIHLEYADGSREVIPTDGTWTYTPGKLRFTSIYDGEEYDTLFVPDAPVPAVVLDHPKDILVPQQGEKIVETQRLPAAALLTTPKGETIIDFGQNLTGYVEFRIRGNKGDRAVIYHAEVLDKQGNFYTENLRAAKQQIAFICDGNEHTYKPLLSFQGFRYIKLENWPGEIRLEDFTAIVVHSEMKRTGWFECSHPGINQLFENIVWGQRGNFLDVPTDCPQRDERLGWTGDAQVFVRTAALNYDVYRFFTKWLADLALEQAADGSVPHVIPDALGGKGGSSAWSDAAVICPWQLYLTYGDKEILAAQFESMRRWVEYMRNHSRRHIWSKGHHFGDWLCLDKDIGGKPTSNAYIATAFAAYSTGLFVKAGKVLGKDMREYETLAENIRAAFRKKFLAKGRVKENTQTACALALYFDLADDKPAVAAQLNALVKQYGHLTTGFVGTPYLLHVLTENGYAETAYDLLLREEYPSWLYPVGLGATTMWERWNGIWPDGSMADKGMNSFNHYAYGAVGDWLYGTMAGINTDENAPGFKHIVFKPVFDKRFDFVNARIVTGYGEVSAGWKKVDNGFVYTVTVPEGCAATVFVGGTAREVEAGTHSLNA